MAHHFKRLAALISASLLRNTADAFVAPEASDALREPEGDQPLRVSLLNTSISAALAQHRSHQSHGSHRSHRSSSTGGGGTRPAPQPRPPPARTTPPPRQADPLGQDPRPQESIPPARPPRAVSDLDPEAVKNIVMRMQLSLQFEGLYDGPIDGIMGPQTRAAVLEFKKKLGIPGDQVFDAATLNAMGIVGL